MGDFEDKLKEIQDKLASQLEKHRQETEEAKRELFRRQPPAHRPFVSATPPSITKRAIDLAHTGYLNQLDEVADDYFQFQKWLGSSLAQYPTIYCETLEEYYQPFLGLLPISETSQQAILDELKSKAIAEAERSGGGEFGVHWPGQGCYLNGWLFAYNRAPNPRAALQEPALVPAIVSTAAHEKFGHGFITEFSAWGQEKKSIQLWRYDIARRFHLQLSDSPQEALLAEKWSIVFGTSRFCEEGYASWVERFLLRRFQETNRPLSSGFPAQAQDYSIEGVMETFHQVGAEAKDSNVSDVLQKVVADLALLFGAGHAEPAAIQEALMEMAQFDDMFGADMSRAFGQPFRYVLGFLILEKLSRQWGALCVPYAVLLATNVTYDIANIPMADLNLLVQQDSRLNIDTRLALISLLPGDEPNNPQALAHAAHERLNMAIPQVLSGDGDGYHER